ncbi:hypothetical protein [Aminobacter sp. LjRoot7]
MTDRLVGYHLASTPYQFRNGKGVKTMTGPGINNDIANPEPI